ncbi:hypothetical protein SAMD00023353_6500460 [Rosellinia necatrix]|uniref:Uncharacterized protein n=1 Tax=Rosellinia necatrix TaxID=77044 RepID=A0A1W2TSP1_ROSNE|nr:hypothetical protein SAMD00023353_6500460 [Rosellinia necatrix]
MSVKLPPVEKLPLALRKSVRDDWDAKKGDIETKLSEIFGVAWTINVNPNQVYAYAKDGYAKENLGACLHEYFDSATRRLDEFKDTFKEDGVNELNTICHAHAMTIDIDEEKRFSYCGADVFEGQLRLLFAPGNLGTNISYCLDRDVLKKALNEAPPPEGAAGMSYAARTSIRVEFEPKIEAVRETIGELLAKPDIKLTPNFEDSFEKLLAESKVKKTGLTKDWQEYLGGWTRGYFEGLASQLRWQKFEDDELLQEGFHDVVDKGEIAFRIVDKLTQGSYNECVIEDGILYLQTTTKTWGSNVDDAASKLMDKL